MNPDPAGSYICIWRQDAKPNFASTKTLFIIETEPTGFGTLMHVPRVFAYTHTQS